MKKIFIAIFASIISLTAVAGSAKGKIDDTDKNLINASKKGWTMRLGAGYNIGGTAPLPLPVEIRGIEGFNPGLNLSFEGSAEKMLGRCGIRFGIKFETKGMTTNADTKNYYMEVANGEGTVSGYWTGKVETKVKNSYLTVPVVALYRINERWNISAGAYASYLLDGEFSGSAYDGYLREGDPTGEKTELESAAYDFSSDICKFQYGVQAGAEYKIYKHLAIFADLKWGLNGIFPSNYSSITFALYPIYGTLGFTYIF